jgi:hypothetical protein
METFPCTCGSRLFFNNTFCTNCGSEVAWCEGCRKVAPIVPVNGRYSCANPKCGAAVVKCHNFAVEAVCNRVFTVDPAAPPIVADPLTGVGLCKACRLNNIVPDLSVAGNHDRWANLELAKRQLLYQLDDLGLRYAPEDVGTEFPLQFDFQASTPETNILTGHADGLITINLNEADSVERERVRKQMHEPHRSLIGHFRHEVGHYYWMTLVDGKCEDACNAVFGDYRTPPYAEALARHYTTGAAPGWQGRFVSAYATAHPWEDFAETWGFYFDMCEVLTTMHHHLPGLAADPRTLPVEALAKTYQQLGVFFNEVNRTMGLKDLVPEVISDEVVTKLAFIHDLIQKKPAPRPPVGAPAPPPPVAPTPAASPTPAQIHSQSQSQTQSAAPAQPVA